MSQPRTGWLCPKCGRGISPDHQSCDHGEPSKAVPYLPLRPQLSEYERLMRGELVTWRRGDRPC